MAKQITTEEIQKLDFWPEILTGLNAAAADLKRQFPGTKVELVRKKYVFWLTVNGVAEWEISCEDLQKMISAKP